MSFTVIIPFWNGHQYIDKLLSTIPDSIPIVIIDDLSDKPLTDISHPNAQIIRIDKKGYFTGAVNQGIRVTNGSDILILNQDTYFSDNGWLKWIEEQCRQYDLFGEAAGSHPAWPQRYIHGTFMYVKRTVIDKVGLMDEKNYPLWGSTCEYQLRACRKGFKANPAQKVPSFVHKRRGPYGSAIQQSLKTIDQRGKFIRTPPAVSVIITCYNHGRYLKDAVNSLIGGQTSLGDTEGQTFQAFEIIIVDDGSTDDSAQIAESLTDPLKGVHLVRQENKGSASAMNTGILASHARQDSLIAVLDGDDMMESSRLERMLSAYDRNPHSVIYDNVQYFGNGKRGVIVDWETGKTITRLNLKTYDFEQMLISNKMHKGLLYPRKAWEEAGGYPVIMNKGREDWAFNIALGIKGWCGINTGEYEYLYRREGQNRTLKNTSPKHHQFFLGQMKSLFPAIYEGERPMACCGGGRNKNGREGGAASMAKRYSKDLPGQEGMVILEYVGGNAGNETWYGPVTGTVYVLGGSKKRGYVDKHDAYGDPAKRIVGMLDIRDRGKKVFIEIPPEEKTKLITEIVTDDVHLVDPSTLLVSDLKNHILDLSLSELEDTLSSERLGKNRSTAIAAIEARLENVA